MTFHFIITVFVYRTRNDGLSRNCTAHGRRWVQGNSLKIEYSFTVYWNFLIFTFLIIHWTIQTILGRWSGLWRRSKIHICPYFGFTRIPKKRLSNAKSTFSIRFRTSHRWLGIYVLLCRKRFSTSPAQVSENEILDKLNIFIKVDKDLIMSCFFLLRLYGNVKSAMKFLLR